MRQRFSSHTTLIELTVVLLCFLLASVIILGLFTGADAVSRHSAKLREATTWAQECAELIAGGEDALQTLIAAGYIAADGVYIKETESGLLVQAELETEQTEVGALLNGRIRVLDGEEELFSIPAARYYNKEVMHP